MALSTTESEYMALTQATKEAISLRHLCQTLGFDQESMIIMGDNQSSIALAKNPAYHTRSKHIDIQYHFLREKVTDCTVQLQYCPTEDMVADILTKPLAKEKHTKFTEVLGLKE